MQFESSPSLLPRHGALPPGSVGCFSIEDLKGMYDAQSPDFRSLSVPRRMPGPRYCGAPRYNNPGAPYVNNFSSPDSDEDEDDECNPEFFRKAKTHNPRKSSNNLYSTLTQFSLHEDSDSDLDEDDSCRRQVFSRSLTVRRNPESSIPVKKASATGISAEGDALFARMKTVRPDRRAHRSGPVHVTSSGSFSPEVTKLPTSSSESSITLHSSSTSAADPRSTPDLSRLDASTIILEEEDVLALPRAGLGLVQCNNIWGIKTVQSGNRSLPMEVRRETNSGDYCHVSMRKQESLARAHVSRSPNNQKTSPGPAAEDTQNLERLPCNNNKPRHCAVERARALSQYPAPKSPLGSVKGKDHRPPLSPNVSRPSSASNSPARERSPKPPVVARAQRSVRCLKKSHSEMETRTPVAAAAPADRQIAGHSSRAFVRAHSESERTAAKPKSILVVRQSGLERTSSLGRRVRFNDQVDLFTYPMKSTLSQSIN